jgi:hypothetical protein
MRLVALMLAGAAVVLASLLLLLAMVVGVLAPALGLSLLAYAALFVGLLLGFAGAVRLARRR